MPAARNQRAETIGLKKPRGLLGRNTKSGRGTVVNTSQFSDSCQASPELTWTPKEDDPYDHDHDAPTQVDSGCGLGRRAGPGSRARWQLCVRRPDDRDLLPAFLPGSTGQANQRHLFQRRFRRAERRLPRLPSLPARPAGNGSGRSGASTAGIDRGAPDPRPAGDQGLDVGRPSPAPVQGPLRTLAPSLPGAAETTPPPISPARRDGGIARHL